MYNNIIIFIGQVKHNVIWYQLLTQFNLHVTIDINTMITLLFATIIIQSALIFSLVIIFFSKINNYYYYHHTTCH